MSSEESGGKSLLIVATLDTKGEHAAYVRDCVRSLGVKPVLMDVGILGEPSIPADIAKEEVASAAGYDLKGLIKARDRASCVRAIAEGAVIVANRLLEDGRIHGVLGMGGGTGTTVATRVMRSLPFGLPKVMVSTVASRDVREFVGTKDVVMFHSVADLLGMNEFVKLILGQACRAVCGMMQRGIELPKGKPMVAVSAYGANSDCALHAQSFLEAKGYEMVAFHANGCGGMAMEEFVEQGLVVGVLDLTLHEIADEMFGGYSKGIGPMRLEAGGVPRVVAPGGLDNAAFTPSCPMPDLLKGRKVCYYDVRFCVRMGPQEMRAFARIVGEKLRKVKAPTYVLIPRRGWSEFDREGMEFFDPQADQVFVDELKKVLGDAVPVEEMDVHISDPAFARRAVEVLDEMIRSGRR